MAHRSLLRLVGGVVAALLAVVTPIYAEEAQDDLMDVLARAYKDLFELGNVCEPINLLVEEINGKGVAMDLTREAVTTTVRSRLRAARPFWAVLAGFQADLNESRVNGRIGRRLFSR